MDYVVLKFKGATSKLSFEQINQLREHIGNGDRIYLSSKEIADYVAKEFGVIYTDKGMTKLLKRIGFVYKKPKLIPGKADKQEQQKFIAEYKELKSQIEDEVILFADGVHPKHNTRPAYGWILKENKLVIKSNTSRKRLNINGVLDIDNLDVTIHRSDTINALTTLEFFKEIEAKYQDKDKINIICDNARYYKSKIIREYTEKSKINLIFLPSYSPNLNIIERLWRFFHKKITYNKYYQTFKEFEEATLNFFKEIPKYKNELKTLLTENFEIIGS